MLLYMNITRLLFYVGAGVVAWYGVIPWWTVPAFILYDNSVGVIVRVPFTKLKEEPKEFNWQDYKGPNNHV